MLVCAGEGYLRRRLLGLRTVQVSAVGFAGFVHTVGDPGRRLLGLRMVRTAGPGFVGFGHSVADPSKRLLGLSTLWPISAKTAV